MRFDSKTVLIGKLALLLLLSHWLAGARKFYDDDPLQTEPTPISIETAKSRELNEYYDFFMHSFGQPGESGERSNPIPAMGVNTLGEVPDGGWYVKRHYWRTMTDEELARGPGSGQLPGEVWKVIAAKTEGVTPGFTIEDEHGRRFIIKFDPKRNREMATAADVIGSRFFHALGYHVPEYDIVYFDRSQLSVSPDARIKDASGKHRPMSKRDIEELLVQVDPDPDRGYRAVASRFLSGEILGPFRYHKTRSDDSNDIFPHEHRRDLRGLFVFAAWLGHNDIKSLNTLDTIVEENGIRYIKHHLIDFGGCLGSDSFTAKSPRAGNAYMFEWGLMLKQLTSFGAFVPHWAKARYERQPSIGNFEFEIFDPEKWKPNYPIPAFENRLPDDEFWAAKQVMSFSNDQIRALVSAGQYTDAAATDWLTAALAARRDKIGAVYFKKVLPLDRFSVEDGELKFVDLAVRHGLAQPRQYHIRWSLFDNTAEIHKSVPDASSALLPRVAATARQGTYVAAHIWAEEEDKSVTAYIRKEQNRYRVVGIDRAF